MKKSISIIVLILILGSNLLSQGSKKATILKPFNKEFSIGIGYQSIVNWGMHGPNIRAYIPLPLGLRLVGEYSNFGGDKHIKENVLLKHIEYHISGSIHAKLIETNKVSAYGLVGLNYNYCYDKSIDLNPINKDYEAFDRTQSMNIDEGYGFYDFAFGVGGTYNVSNRIFVFNEWSFNTFADFKGTLGVKFNLINF